MVNADGPRWQKFTALLPLHTAFDQTETLLATVKKFGLVPTGRVR